MNTLLTALGDPTIRSWYLAFCVALMALPMVGLAWWNQTTMQRQAEGPPSHHTLEETPRSLAEAEALVRDIASIKNKIYWITGLWALANAVAFGLLIWADQVNGYVSGR